MTNHERLVIPAIFRGLFLLIFVFNISFVQAGIPTIDVGNIVQTIQQLQQAKKAYKDQLEQHKSSLRNRAHDLKKYDKAFWKDDIKELERKLKEVNDMLDFYKAEYKNYAELFVREECNTFEECQKRKDKEEKTQIESEKQAVVAVQKELENQAQNLAQTQDRIKKAQQASLKAENQLQATQANTAMLQITNEQLSEVRRLLIMQINMQKTADTTKIRERQASKEKHDNLTSINLN